jgi:UDP-GlcNAc:undecaprenyl-phosphate GlcNAc-1-phosphate transferase
MPLPTILLAVFLVSAMTSLLVAARLTKVDVRGRYPERSRHWSASGIPRIGGIAVFVAAPLGISIALAIAAALGSSIPQLPDLAGALIAASAILFLVGLLDDLRGVRPHLKLLAQAAAALIVYHSGFQIDHLSLLPGSEINLGMLALPITVVWLVGVSNAFNLIDGLDGLAGGVAIIALVTVAVTGVILGNVSVPIYAVALVGSLLGFLRYNWPSARLFMGDSGSLVVGFVLAVLAVRGATDAHGIIYGIIPIFALAYPLLDTGVAILRRWLRGVPLSRGDRRHVHHQLGALGLGPTKSLAVVYTGSAAVASIGLLVTFAPAEVTVAATLAGVGALLLIIAVGVYCLEYHEFLEAGASLAHAIKKSRVVIQDKIHARDLALILRRAKSMEEVQALLETHAEMFRFSHMKLCDAYSRKRSPGRITQELQSLKLWKLEYPILQRTSDEYDGLCLTIWSAVALAQRPAGAERVARILAPAIAEWIGGRRRTPDEIANAERGMAANSFQHNGDPARNPTLTDIRLLESSWPENRDNTLEA